MLLLPLLSAFGYAIATLALKRGLWFGIGPWRTTFICNVTAGLLFLPLLALGGHFPGWEKLYQPILAGLLFFIGQTFTFLAIAKGDVSIVTPVLGLKSMLIAIITAVVLRDHIPLRWWIASALCVAALSLLSERTPARSKNIRATALLAFASACLFAITDVLVQQWAPAWGPGRFIPLMFGSLAAMSFVLIPFFSLPLRQIPPAGAPWLLGGAVLLAIQALGMAWAISTHGHATALNIAYNTRGIWTVLLVWVVGHWFSSEERNLGRGTLTRRMIGATLLVGAIALL